MFALSLFGFIAASMVGVSANILPQTLMPRADPPTCQGRPSGTTFQYTYFDDNNEYFFDVTCGIDYYGGDLYSRRTGTFQACLEACGTETQCTDVAFRGSTCYLKKTLTAQRTDSTVWSAKKTSVRKRLTCKAGSASDGQIYSTSKGDFIIACGKDYQGYDLLSTRTETFEGCIDTCAATDKCVDVSYVSGACYLKYAITSTPIDRSYVWSAYLVGTQPYVYGTTCENNRDDGKTYVASDGGVFDIQCGVDYFGGDLSALTTPTFDSCMDTCDATSGCINVSYTSGRCYLKNELKPAQPNVYVWTSRKRQ